MNHTADTSSSRRHQSPSPAAVGIITTATALPKKRKGLIIVFATISCWSILFNFFSSSLSLYHPDDIDDAPTIRMTTTTKKKNVPVKSMIKVLHWNNSNSNSNSSSSSTTEDDTGHDLVVPPFESLTYYYENTTGMQKHYGARPVASSSYYGVVHEETNTKNITEASSSSGCPELAHWLSHDFRNPGCKQQNKALVCIFPN